MENDRNAVLVVGSLNYDMIMKVSHFPIKGENLIADQVTSSSGGKGANQATQCAKLGLNTYMVGCVGEDNFGSILKKSLEDNSVITDFIKEDRDSETGFAAVNSLQDGSVCATIVRGANFSIKKEDIDNFSYLFDRVSIVILQLEIPIDVVEYAATQAKKAGCMVLFNAAPAVPVSQSLLNSDYFVVNEVEASYFMGKKIDNYETALESAKEFSEKHCNICIITLGEKGCVFAGKGSAGYKPSLKVPVVETTGAGDSFIGGIAYSVIHKMSLEDSIEFAQKCSSITIQNIGAQPSMPFLSQVINN